MSCPFFYIRIDRNKKIPLFRQVYEKIRDDVLLGRLIPGSRLPATRALAKELKISRNAVMAAYDQLHAEGYTTSRAGSYTRVADDTHYHRYKAGRAGRGGHRTDLPPDLFDISFRTGIPDLAHFPRRLWGRYLGRAARQARDEELSYDDPMGHPGFRTVLADYLYKSRGISMPPEQIVITSGATQALFLAAAVLKTGRCNAVIEDPGGYGVIEILKSAGFALNPVSAGGRGFDVAQMRINTDTRLVYVTPSHQFPMGHIMPAAVRISLLKAVHRKNIFIVEDDYDSEFRYDGAPIHPLKALSPEKVIYIGSFSKVLSPALRIGYAVVPERLLPEYRKMKRFSDVQSPLIDQLALKEFIRDGAFERHVFKMKKRYKSKRDILIQTLKDEFGSAVRIYGENAGLHIVAEFREMRLDPGKTGDICHNRVYMQSVEKHALKKGNHRRQIVFGYGNLDEAGIVRGIRALNRFR